MVVMSKIDWVIKALTAKGMSVQIFSRYHFRVNNRFDVTPNASTLNWHWRDTITGSVGVKPADQFADFIPNFIRINAKKEPPPRPVATRTGWWHCPLCTFRMPDDGSSAAAKKMREHVESEH